MSNIKLSLKKTIFTIQTEGVLDTIGKILKIFAQKLGIFSSVTLIYRIEPHLINIDKLNDSECSFYIINDISEFNNFDQIPHKLYLLPLDEWFKRGSKCLGICKNGQLVSYTWIHKNFYDNLGPVGKIRLEKNEAFIGPFYTDPVFRRRGLYYIIMNNALHYLEIEKIDFLYSASNIYNIATIKVMAKSNFNIIGIIRVQGNNYQIIDFTKEKKLNKKFYNEKN